MKASKFILIKDLLTLTICWSLFLYDIGSIYAQSTVESATVDNKQESQVKSNQQAHQRNDALNAVDGNLSKCETGFNAAEDNRDAQREYRNNLMSQGFNEIDQVFTGIEAKGSALDGGSSALNQATGGIGLQEPGQSNNIEKQEALEKERREIDGKISAQQAKVDSIQNQISSLQNRNNPSFLSSADRSKLNMLRAEHFKESSILQQLQTRKYRLKAEIRHNALTDGAGSVKDADKAVGKARVQAGIQEKQYRDLISKIQSQEDSAEENLRIAEQRISEVQRESEHNADFLIFERAKGAPDESTQKGRNTISNLEILSMASAGMTNLKCADFSRVKSRAYPLFKAATATYIANHLNTTSDYTKVAKECILKCVSLEAIKADQAQPSNRKKYPQFQNLKVDNATANCKTDDGQDGLFENDNVASDDEDEQYASIERMAALYRKLAEFTETKISSQQDALKLFMSAHAAALMEVTSKASLVAAAEAQLAKAEAEKKKAQSSITIYLAIIAILVAINSTCPGCCGCRAAALVAAIALLAMYRKDLAKANQDIAKWKKELQEARIHTHMMCNYPGEDANFEMLNRPSTIPLIYPKSRIMQQVTAQVTHPELDSKSKIATTIEWIRNLQGANQSLAYDERIPSKVEMLGLLQRVGLYLKDSSESIGDKLTEVMFPKVLAVNLESGIGLHDQSGSFAQYLNMKVGAWRLQTYNASLKVNLRKSPVTIEHLYPNQPMMLGFRKYMQKNSPEVYGKLIEQTGFPLPETRAAYLKSVVDMLTQNIEFNTQGLASVRAINNKYAELLKRAREAMEVSAGITDAAMTIKRNPNVCMTGSGDGEMSIDESCACKSANTCTSFNMPQFGSFSAGDLSTNSQFLIDGANSFAKGDSEGGKNSFGKMSDSSSALTDIRKKLTSFKITTPNSGENSKNSKSFNSKSGAKITKSKNGSSSDSNSGLNSDSSNSNSLSRFNDRNKNESDEEKNKDGSADDANAKGSSSTTGQNQGLLANSGAAGDKKGKKKGDSFNINELDFNGLESDDVSEADIDLSAINRMRENEQRRNSSNNGSNGLGGSSSGTYIGADGQVYKNTDGINLNAKTSIFQILSKRYKMSAMPILLKKKEKKEF
ncbi:hypothetical protein [Halobacteriovorax sp. JY17]|uniref:hypothetical protein n=1 Tax=Halobacteriovorax sp. JY17 TaxID=2014617 RepID=UPI000C60714E|nr:hypothetical protein [Halobacteriovorax sp. JY17]PIK15545.1 MAG: hypothetical protein CES88_02150 [Halobacteriovorax sp. JY17]